MDALEKTPALVSCDWLANKLDRSSIRILDASWRLPGTGDYPAYTDYLQRHIQKAAFFDIDAIADQNNPLPHMAPNRQQFCAAMSTLGILSSDHVIVYDDAGIFSAPRVWWTLRVMGHQKVSVLDGGLVKWQNNNLPLTDQLHHWPKSGYTLNNGQSSTHQARFISSRDIFDALDSAVKILDARPKARFDGNAPEPRPTLRRGHMPGACSMPFTSLLNEDKTLKSIEELKDIFTALNITGSTPLMTTCGSGISAAVINLAIEQLGYQQNGLYDGAWAEWGQTSSKSRENQDELFPVEKGI